MHVKTHSKRQTVQHSVVEDYRGVINTWAQHFQGGRSADESQRRAGSAGTALRCTVRSPHDGTVWQAHAWARPNRDFSAGSPARCGSLGRCMNPGNSGQQLGAPVSASTARTIGRRSTRVSQPLPAVSECAGPRARRAPIRKCRHPSPVQSHALPEPSTSVV